MARRPLWKHLPVLAALWLSVPAGAADVRVSADMGPAPVSGAAGAAGSLAGGAAGVTLVPTLTAGLGAPSAAPALAAPSAFPAALAPSLWSAAAPLSAVPAATPAYAAKGAAALPNLPAAFAPALAPGADPRAPAFNASAAYLSPTAGSMFRAESLGREGSRAGTGDFSVFGRMDISRLRWIFDGTKPAAPANEIEPVPGRVSRFEVPPAKWDYFFGRVKARITEGMTLAEKKKQTHNETRSAQIARILSDNGIRDNPAGRARMMELFKEAASATTIRSVATPHGVGLIKPAELATATLEVSFFYGEDAEGRSDLNGTATVTTIIPKEH